MKNEEKMEDIGEKVGRKVGKKIDEVMKDDSSCCPQKNVGHSACANAVYGLGLIGALIYYISTATGFWVGVLGVLKAFVWPAFLVFEAMKFLGL